MGMKLTDNLLDVAASFLKEAADEEESLADPKGGGSRIALARAQRYASFVNQAIAALSTESIDVERLRKLDTAAHDGSGAERMVSAEDAQSWIDVAVRPLQQNYRDALEREGKLRKQYEDCKASLESALAVHKPHLAPYSPEKMRRLKQLVSFYDEGDRSLTLVDEDAEDTCGFLRQLLRIAEVKP